LFGTCAPGHGTAVPGPDLGELLVALCSREGLALITLEESVPACVPEAVRKAVLTVRTAKLQQRAIQGLLKDKQFGPAPAVLRGLP
jgi:hypothetical protein